MSTSLVDAHYNIIVIIIELFLQLNLLKQRIDLLQFLILNTQVIPNVLSVKCIANYMQVYQLNKHLIPIDNIMQVKTVDNPSHTRWYNITISVQFYIQPAVFLASNQLTSYWLTLLLYYQCSCCRNFKECKNIK